MPSYAPMKQAAKKPRRIKLKPINLEWLSRTARATATIKALIATNLLDSVETQHALMALDELSLVTKRSTNRSAAKHMAAAERLTCIAMGFRHPPDFR